MVNAFWKNPKSPCILFFCKLNTPSTDAPPPPQLPILTPSSKLLSLSDCALAKYGDIGLSWFVGEYKGEKTIGHGGSDDGFQTNFVMLPEKSIGIIVMANILPAPVDEITQIAIDIILGNDITLIKPLASIPTWKILKEKGTDEAVSFWNELKLNNLNDYNFGVQQFFNLYFSVYFNREEDAIKIAKFIKMALSKEDQQYLIGLMEYALDENPEKQLTITILDILKKK